MAKEVALNQETAIANFGDFDFGDGGFGDITATDIVISRIGVIGDLSPQKKKGNARFIEGVEVGDLVDISNSRIVARGFNSEKPETYRLLPFARVKEVIEWKPRTQGGGIVSREVLSETMESYAKKRGAKQDEKFAWILPNGNEIIETWQMYCIDIDRAVPVFVPFKKSNLKTIKPWFTERANMKFPKGHKNEGKRLPLAFRTFELGSFLDAGNGNEWPNFTVTDGPLTTELKDVDVSELIALAAELNKQLQEGNVKLDETGMEDEQESERDPF